MVTKFVDEATQAILKKQRERLAEIDEDPFIGYKDYAEALKAYKMNPQAEVLARLLHRENVFISGPAGSGKSTILNRFIDIINGQFGGNFDVAVTASTGIAATVIGGQTIHSFAGLGIDKDPFDTRNISPMIRSKRKRLREVDVLIIDEISMLPAYIFEKLDAVLRWARLNDRPFGGVQLILTGDFLQLPPVSKRGDEDVNTGYSIQTSTWRDAKIVCCYMDKTHRATDQELKYLLAAIASGKGRSVPKVKKIIKERTGGRELCDTEKTYTTLFTTNNNVDKFNEDELAKNENPLRVSYTRTHGKADHIKKLYKMYAVPEEFHYKIGATVMVTSNFRDPQGRLVANGSIGKVISVNSEGLPKVLFNDGVFRTIERKTYPLMEKVEFKDPTTGKVTYVEEPVAELEQFPLRLGYAITVHRSQGQTLDGVVCDLSKVFASGLGYVALSRVKSLKDLVISGWSDRALDIDPLSRKISNYVKREAVKNREQFIEHQEAYLPVLDNELARDLLWDEAESYKLLGNATKGPLDLRPHAWDD